MGVALINGLFVLIGVIVGWGLSEVSTSLRSRARLCFTLTQLHNNELIEKELRTKTSLSEYSIEVSNVGQSPCLIEYIELRHKGTIVIDCFLEEGKKLLKPFHSSAYELMEQDANALEWHCKEDRFDHCKVIAYSVDGKKYKGKLDISWIAMRVRLREEINTV